MMTIKRSLLLSYSSLAAVLLAAPAHAATAPSEMDKLMKAVQEQSARLEAQEEALKRQQKALLEERKRFEQLSAQVEALTGKKPVAAKASAEEQKVADAATPRASASPTTSEPQEVGVERKQDKSKPPEIAAYIEEGGVLLQQGKLVVTPGLEYSRSSATRVAISGFSIIPALNIGLFDITQVSRDTLTPSLGLRYGITNRIEVETKIPYVYRSDVTRTRPVGAGASAETLTDVNGYDIGDVEFGAHYQINDGKEGWPYFIGNLRFKTTTGTSPFDVPLNAQGLERELPTGTGFYALQPSITAIFPSDPVVYYANLGYLHNFGRNVGGNFGKIEPGDSVSASFGTSLSLNDRASFSIGYSHNTVFKTSREGLAIPNSEILQVGTMDFGYSYNLDEMTNLNFTVSAGITDDAPDARLNFRVPMSFDLK